MTDVAIRALRVDVFVPSELTPPGGPAASFVRTWASMRQPAIESIEPVQGGSRVVVIETDYGLLEELGAYDAPADQS